MAASQQVGQSWGLQLVGYTEGRARLDDAQWLRGLLVRLADAIGMTIVNGPTVHSFRSPEQPDAGLSAIAIIAESHMAVHTWPPDGYFTLDIGSCRAFDPADARRVVTGMLGVTRMVRDDFEVWQEGQGTVLVNGLVEMAAP